MSSDPAEATPQALEAALLDLAARRGSGRTFCPSEAARALAAAQGGAWRPLMGPLRAAAARLAARGQLRATQKGVAVDAEAARGPIRLGLPPA